MWMLKRSMALKSAFSISNVWVSWQWYVPDSVIYFIFYICGLFTDIIAVSSWDSAASNSRMRTTMENLNQDSKSLCRDFSLGPIEFRGGVLSTCLWCLVDSVNLKNLVGLLVLVLLIFQFREFYYNKLSQTRRSEKSCFDNFPYACICAEGQ